MTPSVHERIQLAVPVLKSPPSEPLQEGVVYKEALVSLTVLFFMMGFITCLNDILVPYMKQVFNLGYTQAALIQFCFFAAYGLTAIPASRYIEKVGAQKGMVIGFIMAAAGCLCFYPAVTYSTYPLFLASLFVLAAGIVLLQVAANPFVASMGPKETASSRLTMVQAFNSFGTFIAPFFGSYFILSRLQDQTSTPVAVKWPYVFIGAVLLTLSALLMKLKFPIPPNGLGRDSNWREVLGTPGVVLGMLAIFVYVGAEVALGSFLVNYVMERSSMEETEAANLVALYWGGAMAGRFLGIFTLREFRPGKVLMFHALLALALILISINSFGLRAIYSIILVGVCNSIMFPTIFTLTIKRLEDRMVQKASGLLGTSILGGAVLPVLTGNVADEAGLRTAFLLPALCYGYIAYFGNKNA